MEVIQINHINGKKEKQKKKSEVTNDYAWTQFLAFFFERVEPGGKMGGGGGLSRGLYTS